ncbi:MAG: hypothetical protein ACJAVM_002130 [Sulfitobacter sp.]|jgi:hypothetical protein
MKTIKARVASLEGQAFPEAHEPPAIVTWIIEPNQPCSIACAWVSGPRLENFQKTDDETYQGFEQRVLSEVNALHARKAGGK